MTTPSGFNCSKCGRDRVREKKRVCSRCARVVAIYKGCWIMPNDLGYGFDWVNDDLFDADCDGHVWAGNQSSINDCIVAIDEYIEYWEDSNGEPYTWAVA